MKNIYKIYLFSFFLLTDFMAFADDVDPGDDDGTGTLEGDENAAPINSKILLLLILGILYGFYKIKKYQKAT